MQTILKYDNATICTNIITTIKDFIVPKDINYACIALSQNKFILPNSSITINLSKCEKALCFLCKSEKVPHSSFYKDK